MSSEVRWGVGCLVGAAATTGAVILLMYIAFTFDVPVWAQLLIGIGLTVGGGLLTWLVVMALETKSRPTDGSRERVVERFPDPPESP
jgi:hypothetical protein